MTAPAAITARGLTKQFDGRVAVDGVDLDVAAGEVFGFLGPNGAGKTTTIRMLTALIAPSGGDAWIDGLALGRDDAAIRARVGVLTETPGLYDLLTARQNLAFFARLYGLAPADADRQIEFYLRRLALWERRDMRTVEFSKGMKQKVALARALIHRPKIVFLDEPTAALDPESARVVHEFIAEMRAEGRTIFLCTHNLDEAQRMCDRVAIFRRRIIRIGSPTELERTLYGRQIEVCLQDGAGLEPLRTLIAALPFASAVRSEPPDRLVVTLEDADTQVPALVTALVGAGAPIRRVAEVEHSLENAYFTLIGAQDGAAAPETRRAA